MANYKQFLDQISSIAAKYNTTVNKDLSNNLSDLYEINKKYQLQDGTEKDFNNAVTFFLYSTLKDSILIDEAETPESKVFRDTITAYYERNLTNDEISLFLNYVLEYNKKIAEDYDLRYTKNIEDADLNDDYYNKKMAKVLKNYFGIDPETLAITPNSYADAVLRKLRELYSQIHNQDSGFTDQEVQFLILYVFTKLYSGLVEIINKNYNYSENNNPEVSYGLYKVGSTNLTSFTKTDPNNKETTIYDLAKPVELGKYYFSLNIKNPFKAISENVNANYDTDNHVYLSYVEDKFVDNMLYDNNTSTSADEIKTNFGYTYINSEDEDPITVTLSSNITKKNNSDNDPDGYYYKINNKSIPVLIRLEKTENDKVEVSGIGEDAIYNFNGFVVYVKNLYDIAKNNLDNKDNNQKENGTITALSIQYYTSSDTLSKTEINIPIISKENLESQLPPLSIPNDDDKQIFKRINSFITGDNSLLSTLSFTNTEIFGESKYNVEGALNFYNNFAKIYVEFNESKTDYVETEENLNDLLNHEKRTSTDVESYYLHNDYNLHYIELNNILINSKNNLKNILNELYALSNPNDSESPYLPDDTNPSDIDLLTFSISVLYKELNPEVRNIDQSNIQNKLLAKLILEDGSSYKLINSEIFEKIYQVEPDEFFIDQDSITYFGNLKTNDYIIYTGRESDLISFLSGDLIGYGRSSQEKQEIELLRKLYRETRDYYYKVLLNKAFITETYYRLYERFFLMSYTIERFMSSKVYNLTNIDLYNDTDCSNFLNSFGLKVLNDQVNENNFSDSLLYKKRIIANYNELMSNKGSRKVIDLFFQIFNYGENEITIYKYLLAKIQRETVDTEPSAVFIRVPYDAKNLSYYIDQSSDSATSYKDFIAEDPYWLETDLPTETINQILVSPQNTKYIGLQLQQSLYENYISSRYALSINEYLYKQLQFDGTNFYSDIELDDVSINGQSINSVNIVTILLYIKLLFALYLYICEAKNNYLQGPTHKNDTTTKRYFGINTDIQLDSTYEDIAKLLDVDKSVIENVFTVPVYNISNSYPTLQTFTGKLTENNDGIYLRVGTNVHPSSINKQYLDELEKGTLTIPAENIFIENIDGSEGIGHSYILNSGMEIILKDEDGTSKQYIIDNPSYKILKDSAVDSTEKYYTSGASNINWTSFIDSLDTAFSSISLINLLNKRNNPPSGKTSSDLENSILLLYKLYKNGDSNKYSDPNIVNETNLSSAISNIKTSEDGTGGTFINDWYSYFFTPIYNFAKEYLHGTFQNKYSINYTKSISDVLDYIFEKFYTVENVDTLGYFPSDSFEKVDNQNVLKNFLSDISTSFTNTSNSTSSDEFLDAIVEELNNLDIGLNLSIKEETGDKSIDVKSYPNSKAEISASNIDITLIQNLIINYCNDINNYLLNYEDMKLNLSLAEDTNNFFDFIKTSVEFFISYTSNLYQSSLVFSFDDPNERFPFSYEINDRLKNNIIDYFYSDYEVTIKDITDTVSD